VHIAVAPTPMPSHAPEEASALGESQTTGTLLGTRVQSERGESESAHRVGVVAVAVALFVCGGFLGGILGRLNFWTFIKPLWSLAAGTLSLHQQVPTTPLCDGSFVAVPARKATLTC
jgi:hypothetical protein